MLLEIDNYVKMPQRLLVMRELPVELKGLLGQPILVVCIAGVHFGFVGADAVDLELSRKDSTQINVDCC